MGLVAHSARDELAQQELAATHQPIGTAWVTQLRCCCGALRRTSPDVLSRASFSAHLDGTPATLSLLVDLAEHIAAEYQLRAKVELEGQAFTIWLSRGDGVEFGRRRQ